MFKNICDLLSRRSGIPALPHSYYSTYWEIKGQMWSLWTTNFSQISFQGTSYRDREGNVSLNPLKWRRKFKSTNSSTDVQTLILINAHSKEVPQFFLRKAVQRLSSRSFPKAVSSASVLELQKAAVKTRQPWRGSEECSWLLWPAPTATSHTSYVVDIRCLHSMALN